MKNPLASPLRLIVTVCLIVSIIVLLVVTQWSNDGNGEQKNDTDSEVSGSRTNLRSVGSAGDPPGDMENANQNANQNLNIPKLSDTLVDRIIAIGLRDDASDDDILAAWLLTEDERLLERLRALKNPSAATLFELGLKDAEGRVEIGRQLSAMDESNGIGLLLEGWGLFGGGKDAEAFDALLAMLERPHLEMFMKEKELVARALLDEIGMPASEAKLLAFSKAFPGEEVLKMTAGVLKHVQDLHQHVEQPNDRLLLAQAQVDMFAYLCESKGPAYLPIFAAHYEAEALDAFEPTTVYGADSTVAGRIEFLHGYEDRIDSLMSARDEILPGLSDAQRSLYFEHVMSDGEIPAMKWLNTRFRE